MKCICLLTVVWDDTAVDNLLDRTQVGDEEETTPAEGDEGDAGMNQYLRSFKVASYQIKQTAEVCPESLKKEGRGLTIGWFLYDFLFG